ncbi:MAG: DUF4105 domain-containing protein [Rhodanobacteraceae bacterium]|nr:DUF4105 domain-containing protein [Rhodanobacteraceae bacterium]MBK7042340.1 DUF4105 domain-containing protein [Rhodanobacteraceae bacterium]MBP9154811.1 DUF4105 domain-containing protein [Xanthomonadales bacterium]HQW80798.1 DUF4105 domain-containing protein [Pseudomonadota bacterium]
MDRQERADKVDERAHRGISRRRVMRRWLLRISLLLLAAYTLLVFCLHPSNQRDWNADQAQLATAEIHGDHVLVHNVRNTRYRAVDDFDVHWEERRYDLARLNSVWFVVEPFADWRGPAHTFLSFGFADGQYLAISVEIRKERGESFSPWLGVLRQYELMYVIGDERDLIGLRANHRKDDVFLYPVRSTPVRMRALFVSMLERANTMAAQPEFYNTLTNTCTSNIVDHIDDIAPGRVPFSLTTLLPGYTDDFAYDLGLIDTELPRDRYRNAFRINERAARAADAGDFSEAIRARD